MLNNRHFLIMLAGAAALVVACGDDDPTIEPPPAPSLGVTANKISDLRPGDEVAISVTVSSFVLDASKMGQPNEAGVGHYHVYWDAATGTDFLSAGADDQVTVKVPESAKDGAHLFRVTLMNNDHTPVSPAVEFKVDVQVKAAPFAPKVMASADKTGDLLPGSPVVLTITTTSFKLDAAKMGQSPEPGVGHYHVYWDEKSGTDFLTAAADQMVSVAIPADAADGAHALRVELYNNDHTPLSPAVMVKINVTVKK